jgi:hypothetical protein
VNFVRNGISAHAFLFFLETDSVPAKAL